MTVDIAGRSGVGLALSATDPAGSSSVSSVGGAGNDDGPR